jgi:putative transposase
MRRGCGFDPAVSEYSRSPVRNRLLDADVYRESGRPVFMTVRAVGHLVPFRYATLNDAVVDTLREQRHRSACDVYAYCLMPDHIHFVTAPRENGGDVVALVQRFKSASTRTAWVHGFSGRLWQPRFYDHVVRLDETLLSICEYVLLNPVRAGLVERVEDYRWSRCVDPIP